MVFLNCRGFPLKMGFLRSFQSRVNEFEVENVVRKPFKRNTNDCIDCISQMKKKTIRNLPLWNVIEECKCKEECYSIWNKIEDICIFRIIFLMA